MKFQFASILWSARSASTLQHAQTPRNVFTGIDLLFLELLKKIRFSNL